MARAWLPNLMGGVACAALFMMMTVAVVDVIGRSVFGKPVGPASELIELAMVVTIFLVYPIVSRKGMHISIDLLDSITPDPLRRAQHVLSALLGAAVFVAVAWRIGYLATDAWSSGEVTGVLGMPLGYVYGFIAAMSVVTALAFLSLLPQAFAPGEFVHPRLPLDEAPE
jgi:TRAP-type C4-dicarboxylate transport system permease small subunit